MRLIIFVATMVGMVGACSTPATTSPTIDFVETEGEWRLAFDGSKTKVGMAFGERVLEFGEVEGECRPAAELPFTAVEDQPALAGLKCQLSGSSDSLHAVIVEVSGPDPSWPAPVALGFVVSRPGDEGKVILQTMGVQQVPLGVVPKPPPAPPQAQPQPSGDAPADTP